MIIVVEPYYTVGHGEFVAGFLDVLLKANPDSKIVFWGHEEFGKQVREHLQRNGRDNHRLELKPAEVPWQDWGIQGWFNEKVIHRVVSKVYSVAVEEKVEAIYFTSATLFTHCQIKRLARKTGLSTYLILHQDLQAVEWKTKPWQKAHYFGAAMKMKNENFRYIVLGKSIRRIARELKLPNTELMIAIDMPCFYPAFNSDLIMNEQIHFGTVGIFKKERGASQLFEFLSVKKEELQNAKFSVRGYEINIDEVESVDAFQEKNNLEFLPRNEYEQWVKKLDYILFFYPSTAYRLMASASVFEAIIFGKPILALRNPYFEDLFERFGAFGKLFDTEKALFDEVARIIAKPNQLERQSYLDQMNEIRRRLDAFEIAKELILEIEG
jgi:glycosyltransferase involved in cell wall biosynthesis